MHEKKTSTKTERKKRTKTERLMLFLDAMAAALTVLAIALLLLGHGVTEVQYLALGWMAEAAHFHQLYAKKESRANSQKYAQKWVNDIGDKHGWDAAARFAEIVLQNSN